MANKKEEKKVRQQRATVEQKMEKKVTKMKVIQAKKPATLPIQQAMNRKRQAVIRPKKRQFQGHCLYCGVWGHKGSNCWWRRPVYVSNLRRYDAAYKGTQYRIQKRTPIMSSCTYCKRQGHADKDCWWKPKPMVSKNKFAILADLEQCERCGQDDHNAKRCMALLPE